MRYIRIRNNKIIQISSMPLEPKIPGEKIYTLNVDHDYIAIQSNGTPRAMTEAEIEASRQARFNQTKIKLLKTVHQKRKELEGQGLILQTSKGNFIADTTYVGRANLQGVILAFEAGLLDKNSSKVHWKFENGFLSLNYGQLKEIGAYILDYVEKLFQAEAQHSAAIQALSSMQDVMNYDLAQFWPSNEYVSQTI